MRWTLRSVVAVVALCGAGASADPIDTVLGVQGALKFVETQALKTAAALSPGQYPRWNGQTGTWKTVGASDWTSGFFPGQLWLLYQATTAAGKPTSGQFLTDAENWTLPLASQASRVSNDPHDVGFIIGESFGNGYRLTGAASYKTTIFAAATTLAAAYNPIVGAVRSWDFGSWTYPVIIDGMMTLAPLEWGGTHGGPAAWALDARDHAGTTHKYLVRSDGSVVHLADFNPANYPTSPVFVGLDNTGAYSATATIARAEAWGIYGYVQAYQMSRTGVFLSIAEKLANYFMANLPASGAPPVDFNAPAGVTPPIDTSAAAIAADALVMLGVYASPTYLKDAEDILGLLSGKFLAPASGDSVLLDGTGSQTSELETSLIYGDYFYTEALVRLEGVLQTGTTWRLYGPNWPAAQPRLSLHSDLSPVFGAPELSTWAMMALGAAALAIVRRFGPNGRMRENAEPPPRMCAYAGGVGKVAKNSRSFGFLAIGRAGRCRHHRIAECSCYSQAEPNKGRFLIVNR